MVTVHERRVYNPRVVGGDNVCRESLCCLLVTKRLDSRYSYRERGLRHLESETQPGYGRVVLHSVILLRRRKVTEKDDNTELLTVVEAARLYGFSARTIARWIEEQRIPCSIVSGHALVARGDLEAMLRRPETELEKKQSDPLA